MGNAVDSGRWNFQESEMATSILVVDDSKVNRFVAETKLQEAGYEVVVVEDGKAAFEALGLDLEEKTMPFDAVLLDVMMPEIDGMEVLARIREKWTSIELPVIMTTAKDERENILEALEAGANDYVPKPLDLAILMARLTTHLELKESHEELKRAQRSLLNAARIESVGLLAAGVAHEIRNPLGRIGMAVQGLGSLVEKLPELERTLGIKLADTIRSSVEEADKIVRGLMKASEEQHLILKPADLERVLKQAVAELSRAIGEAGVKVVYDFASDLPEVALAEEEFQMAIHEILENAVQAMRFAGSEKRELRLRTEMTLLTGIGPDEGSRVGIRPRDNDEVIALYIEDTGPGIREKEIDRAADAFFTTKATGQGTGLGLTVARKIIELHHGILRWENRTGDDGGLQVSVFLKTSKGFRTTV